MKAKSLGILAASMLLMVTSCSNVNIDIIKNNAKDEQTRNGNATLVFNSIRGDIVTEDKPHNIGDVVNFNVVCDDTFNVYKVECNNEEVKPTSDGNYSITLKETNYVRVLFGGAKESDFKFRSNRETNSYDILEYNGPTNVKDLILPREHNGFKVTGCVDNALYGEFERIYVPETFTSFKYGNFDKQLEFMYFYKEISEPKENNHGDYHPHEHGNRIEAYAKTLLFEGDEIKDNDEHRPPHEEGEFDPNVYHAISEVKQDGDWKYVTKFEDNQVFHTSISYDGDATNLEVPSTFNNDSYIKHEEVRFESKKDIKTIRFAPTNRIIKLKRIFNIELMYLPISVTSISAEDFYGVVCMMEGSDTSIFNGKAPNIIRTNVNGIPVEVDHIKYLIKDNEAKIFEYNNGESVINIPNEITVDGATYPVTEILPCAFANSHATMIFANENLKVVGEFAFNKSLEYFEGNKNLKEIRLGALRFGVHASNIDSVTRIEEANFFDGEFVIPSNLEYFEGDVEYEKEVFTSHFENEIPSNWNLEEWFINHKINYGFISHEGYLDQYYRYDLIRSSQGDKPNARITYINDDTLYRDHKYLFVPEKIDGYTVTEIKENVFPDCVIKLPGTITRIEEQPSFNGVIFANMTQEKLNNAIVGNWMVDDYHIRDTFARPDLKYVVNSVTNEHYVLFNNDQEAMFIINYGDGVLHPKFSEVIGTNSANIVGYVFINEPYRDFIFSTNTRYIYSRKNTITLNEVVIPSSVETIKGLTEIVATDAYYYGATANSLVKANNSTFNVHTKNEYIFTINDDDTCNLELINVYMLNDDRIILPTHINTHKIVKVHVGQSHRLRIYFEGDFQEAQDVNWLADSYYVKIYFYSSTKPHDLDNNYWCYTIDNQIHEW